ncbi:2-dehydropantoate 2-reductase [Frondihabitans sp. PhB188]|uniref:ketopantoate reductase family protein n=1 Tax=Frondihabitans sp. PhB188 TaxID=2485200 RepID=UPI000F48AC9A|nr:2-dehydropantoate 2-reductase N-terminal domain-containing protein [Frondihabitans sp. PhB188]ROQ40022.1 2-dehydropantoate 2-reductase [Frondihabitans sp. PhB188]
MRYVIIGAGAIGGVLGARLAQHGKSPLLIARGEHGDVIASAGMRLRSPDDDTVVRIPVASKPAGVHLRVDDVLVFATKTQSLDAAVREWVDEPVYVDGRSIGTAGALLPAFIALNGIEGERIAARYFDRVYAVCVWLPGVHLVPGEVIVRIAPSSGTFIVGPAFGGASLGGSGSSGGGAGSSSATGGSSSTGGGPGSTAGGAAADPLLLELQRDWQDATFRIFLDDDVLAWKHRKLLSNLGNALQALLGPDAAPDIYDDLRSEAEAVYRALGITWPSDDDEAARRGNAFDLRPVPGTGELGGSSWQSVQRGGSIETDYLNGEISLLARSHGLDAPLNAEVQRLARSADGAMSVERLRELLERVAAR